MRTILYTSQRCKFCAAIVPSVRDVVDEVVNIDIMSFPSELEYVPALIISNNGQNRVFYGEEIIDLVKDAMNRPKPVPKANAKPPKVTVAVSNVDDDISRPISLVGAGSDIKQLVPSTCAIPQSTSKKACKTDGCIYGTCDDDDFDVTKQQSIKM